MAFPQQLQPHSEVIVIEDSDEDDASKDAAASSAASAAAATKNATKTKATIREHCESKQRLRDKFFEEVKRTRKGKTAHCEVLNISVYNCSNCWYKVTCGRKTETCHGWNEVADKILEFS
jgi:hypothetical protein